MLKSLEIFDGTGIEISSEGKRYLGGVIGLSDLLKHLVDRKVQEWVDEIKKLSEITITQPQSAYAAFTRGLSSRWTYLLRITDPTCHSAYELFQPLEDVIFSSFIPALTGHCTP